MALRGAIESDGRRQRALMNRDKVARVLELINEQGEVPTARDVAERARLSRRTVFRLFENLDDVRGAASEIQRAEVIRRFPRPLGGPTLEARVDALVEHRSALYEHIMPTRRLTEAKKHRVAILRDFQAKSRAQLRLHLEAHLGPDLPADATERSALLDAVQVATSWHSWAQLRDDHGYDVGHAQAVVRRMALALLR